MPARVSAAQQTYTLPKEPCHTDGFDSPGLRYLAFRFPAFWAVAFISVSRAHVMGFASTAAAARSIASFSASVNGMRMLVSLRSSGLLGGLAMRIILYTKMERFSLARKNKCVHNNNVDWDGNPTNKNARTGGNRNGQPKSGWCQTSA
jgi:hypothetical protein